MPLGAAVQNSANFNRTMNQLMPLNMTMLGRENSGKTALLIANDLIWMGEPLTSGLQMNLLGPDGQEMSPLVLTSRMETTQRRLWAMSEDGDGLKTTLNSEPVNYVLCEGAEPRFQLLTNEEIGQVISHSKEDSSPDELRRYHEYLKRLSKADLITLVFSPPSRDPHSMSAFQWAKDQKLYAAYLNEALRLGDPTRPVAVAMVVNKVDTIFDDEASARAGLTDEVLMGALEGMVQTLRHSPRVVHAAIFPTSVYGFGNAVARETVPAENGEEADGADSQPWAVSARRGLEKEFGIRDGHTIEPFNMQALAIWTLLAAALPKEVEVSEQDSNEVALARTCRMLSEDLASVDGWFVTVKGDLG